MPDIHADFRNAAARLVERLADSPASLPAFRRRITAANVLVQASVPKPPRACVSPSISRIPIGRVSWPT